jgi:6-phosphogluconolactonase/glucosamine-6-phosphate isomerase/deaminase
MDVAAPTTSTPAVPRCTLTMQMLNASRFVAPFIMGADKAPILQRVADGASPDELPIAGLRPVAGELRWFLDAAACGRS